ncbi:MAG: hypothetical protein KGJ50_13090, partial [Xanthomonadaceae bacterium]|nr:hypothetical protein [Xanthomonadaceae bacterium]
PRLDTHLTVPAAYRIFSLCLDRLGLGCPFPLDLSVETELVGDISDRFFGVPLTETYLAPAPAFVATYTGALELVERIDDGIHHIGTRYAWRNELAPIDLKVVAFGNSFFERGGTARSITWWFQRAFREFHFLWSPELNMDYVRMIKPDIVVCQTIERFLGRLPDDKF